MINKKSVVIVDGYSSGMFLAPELKKRGFGKDQGGGNIIHVQSTEVIPVGFKKSFVSADYDVHIVHSSLSKSVEILKQHSVVAVMAGAEMGVNLADHLSEALGLRTNGTILSEARRDKYIMAETIRAAGILAVKQVKVKTLKGALDFQESHGKWPIVMKPLKSAGTDGVSICYSTEDMRNAFERVIEKKNALGLVNSEVLIQEFLEGEEYVLNTVSRDGESVTTDMWRYVKKEISYTNGTFRVYYRMESMGNKEKTSQQLREYGIPVLKALNIVNGPAHMEIIVTKRGPILVEVGARVMGDKMTRLVSAATNGRSQIESTVNSYLFPDFFLKEIGKPSVFSKTPLVVWTISYGGTLRSSFVNALKQLPSYYHNSIHVEEGKELPVTKDLFSSPGSVWLLHEDPNQVEEDAQKIAKLSKEYFLEGAQTT